MEPRLPKEILEERRRDAELAERMIVEMGEEAFDKKVSDVIAEHQFMSQRPKQIEEENCLWAFRPFQLPQPLEHHGLGLRVSLNREEDPEDSCQVRVTVTDLEDRPKGQTRVSVTHSRAGVFLEGKTDARGEIVFHLPSCEATDYMCLKVGGMTADEVLQQSRLSAE